MVKNAKYLLEIFDYYMNQYVVPIFQRRNGWTPKQIDYFIETLLEDKNPYMSEIKIYPNSDDISIFDTSLIIDGQQRMTTYSLTVLAICAYCKKHELNHNYKEDLFNRVIINKRYDGEQRFRLKLQESDNLAYQKCVVNLEESLDKSSENFNPKVEKDELIISNIIPSYNHIYSLIDETNIDKLYFAIQKVQVMYSELEPHDNLRRIFFASNNAGLKISLEENVKSILIYGYSKEDSEQIAIYNKYWKPLETYFYSLQESSLFRTFIHSFVQYKSNSFTTRDALSYISKFQESSKSCKELLKGLYEFFICFKKFYESDFDSCELKDIVTFLNPFAHSYLYTLLIKVYELSDGESELLNCFRLIETHIFRNSLLNTQSSDVVREVFNLNRLCTAYNLSDEIYSQIKYSDFYVDNNTFKKGFLEYSTGTTHNKQRRQRLALVRIVKKDSGDEDFNYNNTSLEHINSQKPKKYPVDMSIEEYEKKYCYTFKNVTLIPIRYNSKLKNKEFEEKRDMDKYGYKYSKMEINQQLSTNDHFNKKEMENWGLYLFKKALSIWSFDEDPQQSKLM